MSAIRVIRSPLCRYLDSIRNPWKRAYARAYCGWLVRGPMREEDDAPEWRPNLSTMAAQAVRLRVAELYAADDVEVTP